jgi:hypothetical protein
MGNQTLINLGRQVTTGNTNSQLNAGSNNQYGSKITTTESGTVQFLDCYVSASGGAGNCVLCLWDSAGNLVAQSATFTLANGAGTGVNQQAFQRQAVVTPYFFASGVDLYVGFWRAGAISAVFSYINTGGPFRPNVGAGVANTGAPGALSIATSTTGQMCAYIEYARGGVVRHNGTSFLYHPLKRHNGTSFLRHPLKRWNGSSWIRVA